MLYKTFKEKEEYYVYDTVSNNIFCISEAAHDVLNNKKSLLDLNESDQKMLRGFNDENILKLSEYKNFKFDLLDNFENNFKLTEDSVKKLTLVLNQSCNMNCKYCLYCDSYKSRKNLNNSKMSLDTVYKSIDFYFEHSSNVKYKNITFYGGEPLVDYDLLVDSIIYARKKYGPERLKINLTSNGTLLNEDIIKFFDDNRIFLNISLDGPKEMHDKNRLFKDKKETFDIIMEKIKLISQRYEKYFKKYVAISVTVVPPYEYQIIEKFLKNDEILKYLKLDLSYVEEKDADWLIENKEVNDVYGEKLKKESTIIKKCTENFLINEKISGLYKNIFFTRLKTIANRDMKKIEKDLEIKGPCFPGISMLVVNTDGEFNICTMLDDCFSIGNINDGFDKKAIEKSLEDINEFINSNCKKCWLIRLCHPCLAKFNQGERMPKRSDICNYRRLIYLEIIKAYLTINNK